MEQNIKKTFIDWLKSLKKPKWECYEIYAYSRFAGCKSQCEACSIKQHTEKILNN